MTTIHDIEERKQKLVNDMANALEGIRPILEHNKVNEFHDLPTYFRIIKFKTQDILKLDLKLDAQVIAVHKRVHKIIDKAIELTRHE